MKKTIEKITIRKAALSDCMSVMNILAGTGFFRPGELEIAKEVFTDAARAVPGCTYQSYIARIKDKIASWVCFSPTPCTIGTFDIYWLAVDIQMQRKRIGSQLMDFAIEQIRLQKGRLAVIETSGTDRYLPTCRFYERNKFVKVACIPAFYAPGDDKIIYIRNV